jgi:integrase
VRQRKTGRPVRFELTEQTRQTIDEYLTTADKKPGQYLFNGRRPGESMSTQQYARLLADWLVGIGLDPHVYGRTRYGGPKQH